MKEPVLIAERVPPGDRWSLLDEDVVIVGLTETLEAWVRKHNLIGVQLDYLLSTYEGKLYVLQELFETKQEPEIKKYSIYGDYESIN